MQKNEEEKVILEQPERDHEGRVIYALGHGQVCPPPSEEMKAMMKNNSEGLEWLMNLKRAVDVRLYPIQSQSLEVRVPLSRGNKK
jgi:hypothetical protein